MSSICDETYHLGEFEPRPDDDTIICRCEEITRGEIRRAIHDGMYTINEVKRFLRVGMGLCQGQSCIKIVRGIIAEELGIPMSELSFTEGIGELGTVLFSQIGGSMGPIYGTIFMEMSDAGEGCAEIGLPELIGMLEHGMNGLLEIVDARVGDKTLVDTLSPALDALKQAQTDGKTFYDALDDMKAAAVSGRDSTMDLVAQYGRAARLGERSKGVLDAGAASCCLLLNAMADGIQAML